MSSLMIIIVSLILSAFFSGMEIAFITANKLRIQLNKQQGNYIYIIVGFLIERPAFFIATMLVGNNIALVVYGIVMTVILSPYIQIFFSHNEMIVLIIQTIFSTTLILVTAEFLPKTLFRIKPNIALNIFAVPVLVFYIILFPITWLTVFFSNFLLKKIFKLKFTKSVDDKIFSKIDIDNLLTERNQTRQEETDVNIDIKIFQNALDFSKVKLRECMVPRTEIVAMEINEPIENLKQEFIDSGFSKILIYKDTIDNIVGYFKSSDIFKRPKTIQAKLIRMVIAPETMPANKLLETFIKQNKSVALVVDEFGGTSGMVTIEDIMEEIFGEIEDEHDDIDHVEKQLKNDEFLFSGRVEIDHLNEKYGLGIKSEGEYETLAGYILYNTRSIPKLNDYIDIHGFRIKIIGVTQNRIELVNLKVLKGN